MSQNQTKGTQRDAHTDPTQPQSIPMYTAGPPAYPHPMAELPRVNTMPCCMFMYLNAALECTVCLQQPCVSPPLNATTPRSRGSKMRINPTLVKQHERQMARLGLGLWRQLIAASNNSSSSGVGIGLAPAQTRQELDIFTAQSAANKQYVELPDNRNMASLVAPDCAVPASCLPPINDDPLTTAGSELIDRAGMVDAASTQVHTVMASNLLVHICHAMAYTKLGGQPNQSLICVATACQRLVPVPSFGIISCPNLAKQQQRTTTVNSFLSTACSGFRALFERCLTPGANQLFSNTSQPPPPPISPISGVHGRGPAELVTQLGHVAATKLYLM